MKHVTLKRGKEDSLLRFHPWVFSGALQPGGDGSEPQDGDIVRVDDSTGRCLAVGHYQRGSIAVRILAFRNTEIDQAFWRQHIASALTLRQTLALAPAQGAQASSQASAATVPEAFPSGSPAPGTTAYRLIHGEGDSLPGLVIDIYGDTAVMQAHSVGMHRCRADIARALKEVMGDSLNHIYYKSETTLPFLDTEGTFLLGGQGASNIALENGLRFHVDWLRGQKTGFFVDQRDNRALVERYSKGRKVLNMFCYTGGFSFYALRGGAALVHSVDSSEKAIVLTRRNVELNFPGDSRHDTFCEDAFRFLGSFKSATLPASEEEESRQPFPYDLVILDPPAFAKHRAALHNALKGYIRLNSKALERMPHGSLLFTFSCSQVVTKDNFRNAVFTAAAQARRSVRILHQLHQPADHPVNIYHPEGEYLKGLVLYVE